MSRFARVITSACLILSSLLTIWCGAATSSTAEDTLRKLTKEFSAARAMPLGSRPRPPNTDLAALNGLPSSAINAALGPEDMGSFRPECHAPVCWSFTYGPGPAPFHAPVDNGNGTVSVEVTTGGPWLLVIGLTSGHVATAFWQGQR